MRCCRSRPFLQHTDEAVLVHHLLAAVPRERAGHRAFAVGDGSVRGIVVRVERGQHGRVQERDAHAALLLRQLIHLHALLELRDERLRARARAPVASVRSGA